MTIGLVPGATGGVGRDRSRLDTWVDECVPGMEATA